MQFRVGRVTDSRHQVLSRFPRESLERLQILDGDLEQIRQASHEPLANEQLRRLLTQSLDVQSLPGSEMLNSPRKLQWTLETVGTDSKRSPVDDRRTARRAAIGHSERWAPTPPRFGDTLHDLRNHVARALDAH